MIALGPTVGLILLLSVITGCRLNIVEQEQLDRTIQVTEYNQYVIWNDKIIQYNNELAHLALEEEPTRDTLRNCTGLASRRARIAKLYNQSALLIKPPDHLPKRQENYSHTPPCKRTKKEKNYDSIYQERR